MSPECSGRASQISQNERHSHCLDDQPCLLCGSSNLNGVDRHGSVRQLQCQVNRARNLALLIQSEPRAPADGEGDDWRRKCENLGEELKTERENGGAQQAEIQRLEEQLRADSEKWQSLKTQLEEEAELQEEKLRSLQDELRETARQLQGARGALNDPINEVRKELYQKRGELEIKEKDNREMKYRLRERELEVEILERRLLEEDDTNRVWKYKYVGSL